jgi:hypothetical protein
MVDNGALVIGIVAVVAFVGLFVMVGSGSLNDITGQAVGDTFHGVNEEWRSGEHLTNPNPKSDHDADNKYRPIQHMDNPRPGFTGENDRLSKASCVEEDGYTIVLEVDPVYGAKELRRYKDSADYDYRCINGVAKRFVME